MNKRVKGILAGCGVLALLGGGLAALKLTDPGEPEESSAAEENTSTPLWHAHSDDINRITVENANGDSYTANRKMESVDTTDVNGEAVTEDIANYYLEGYESLPMSTVSIRLLATRSPELSSVATVEENAPESSYATYGLDQPIKVTYSVDDADDIVFYVGDISPVPTYSYLRLEGDPNIYTVDSSAVEPFRSKVTDYLGTTLKEEQADGDTTYVESTRITRKDLDYDLYFEYDSYYEEHTNGGGSAQHVMVEPIPCLLSPDKSAPATHGLFGLTATEVVQPMPSAADLTKYGFDDPFVTVTTKLSDGSTYVFEMGSTYTNDEGTTLWYGKLSGLDCVYGFSADDTVYENVKAEDVSSKIVVDSYVWDIGHLKYEADGKTWDFVGQGTSADDYVMTYNGKSYENLEHYRLLYTYLLKTAAEDLILEDMELSGEPMARITIEEQNDARSYEVTFYDGGGMKAYIAVNGIVRFSCRKAYVTTLIQNLNQFDDEEKAFSMSW